MKGDHSTIRWLLSKSLIKVILLFMFSSHSSKLLLKYNLSACVYIFMSKLLSVFILLSWLNDILNLWQTIQYSRVYFNFICLVMDYILSYTYVWNSCLILFCYTLFVSTLVTYLYKNVIQVYREEFQIQIT